MPNSKVLYKIQVWGRVQGVGYRQACLKEARLRGLKGFVKNLSDGSVYVEAEGDKPQLDELLTWCRNGTGYGYVEEIRLEISEAINHSSFIVKY